MPQASKLQQAAVLKAIQALNAETKEYKEMSQELMGLITELKDEHQETIEKLSNSHAELLSIILDMPEAMRDEHKDEILSAILAQQTYLDYSDNLEDAATLQL